MLDPNLHPTFAALHDLFFRYFKGKRCSHDDSHDFASDLIAKLWATESSRDFVLNQQSLINEHRRIPFRLRQEAGSLLKKRFDGRREEQQRAEARFQSQEQFTISPEVLDDIAGTLSAKEALAFELMRNGYSRSETAQQIGITTRTLRNYMNRWRKRLGDRSPFSRN